MVKQFKFKNDYLSQFRTNFDDHLFILVCYYLQRYVTENVAAYRNVLFCQNLLLISWRILWIQKHETWSPWWIENTDNCQILQEKQLTSAIFMMNLPNLEGSRIQKGIQLTSNYCVDFSILHHCGSQAYTCGNIDLSQSSAITVKRCWHIHHPLSKRLIQSPERLGIGWSDVISPLLYAAMVTLLAKPGGHS